MNDSWEGTCERSRYIAGVWGRVRSSQTCIGLQRSLDIRVWILGGLCGMVGFFEFLPDADVGNQPGVAELVWGDLGGRHSGWRNRRHCLEHHCHGHRLTSKKKHHPGSWGSYGGLILRHDNGGLCPYSFRRFSPEWNSLGFLADIKFGAFLSAGHTNSGGCNRPVDGHDIGIFGNGPGAFSGWDSPGAIW